MRRARMTPALGFVVAGCGYRRGALDPAGAEALTIANLWWVFFWTSVLVFGAVLVALALATRRGRARERDGGPDPEPSPPRSVEQRSERAVLAATVLSVFILVGLLFASVASGNSLFEPKTPARRVRLIAHQWWWEVQYPGARNDQLVNTANELHLPAGTRIELELKSTDVIHSLWIPNLHGKRDLIPGHTNYLSLEPQRPGRYVGHCAEFCGAEHARMDLAVVVEPPAVFGQWLSHQREVAPVPRSAEAKRGGDAFLRGPCAMCHNVNGTDASASAGPDLTHFASRPWIGAGALPNTAANLRRWLTDPQHVKPGAQMPPLALPETELSELVAYLETLR